MARAEETPKRTHNAGLLLRLEIEEEAESRLDRIMGRIEKGFGDSVDLLEIADDLEAVSWRIRNLARELHALE